MSRTSFLWSLFALQALCSGYFIIDVIYDFIWPNSNGGFADSDTIEALVTFALFLGLAFTGYELWGLQSRHNKLDEQIKIASGAFSDVLENRFLDWSLTSAEREVAILAIKGFSIAEIAELRTTKQGTIKAQCASVYRKADVSGRLQLLSLFVDDLIADDLLKEAKATSN